jgi:hypothetical protein
MITCSSESTLKSMLIDDDDGPERSIKKKEIVRGLFKQLISTSPTEMMIFHTYMKAILKIRTGDFDEFI